MKKLLLLSWCFLLLCAGQLYAQTRTITGTVKSKDDGLPIPGVTVTVKGTTNGTQTGVNGDYSLNNVPATATLVFRFIGYSTQEVVVGARTSISPTLAPSASQLNEVVVTSLGIVRPSRSLSYGVSKVTNEQLTQKSEPDVLKALQGKVAGVDIRASQGTPGSATRINIRGNTSFQGENQPLIVVDGIPYSNDQLTTTSQLNGGGAYSSGISNLDPNDIASMNILKGSNAAALYGSRASNGAIIITTKSGSASRSRKGFEATYKSSASIEQIANLPTYQNSYGAGSYGNYSNSNGSWGPKFGTLATIPTWPDYLPYFNNAATIPYQAYPDNVKDLFQNGAVYENSLNLNGGDDKTAFNATASQLNQKGYVPNSSFNRSSVAVGGSSKLTNGLNVRGNLSYTRTTQEGGFFGENQVAGVPSEFARTLLLARNWDLNLPFEGASGNSLTPNGGGQFDNPRWAQKYNRINSAEERYIANLRLDYNFTKWLNLSENIGSNVNNVNRREVIEVGSRAAAGLGSLTVDSYRRQDIESNTILSFNPKVNEDFTVNGLIGFNFSQRTATRNLVGGNQFNIRGIHTLDNTIQKNFYADTYSRRRIMGALGELTLGYKNYAFLTFDGRNDWSSTLPVSNRSYFYPAVSGSFVFTDALKLESKVLDYGKLRLSYAKVGRDADPYQLDNYFALGTPFLGQTTAGSPTTSSDPNLKPEFTREFEVGTELSFFNSRINLDVALYDKKSTNLILAVPVAASSGFSSAYTNAGEISNKGIELELGVKIVRSKNFNYDLSANFTHNVNMVEKILPGVTRIDLGTVLTTVSTYAEAGMPYGYLRGTVNYRDGNGNLIINPANGTLIVSPDQAYIGNPNPRGRFNFINTFKYKGFLLNAQIDMTFGGSIYSTSVNGLLGRGVTKDTEDRETTWVIPGVYGDATGNPYRDAAGNTIPNTTRIATNDLYFASSATAATFAVNGATEWSVYDASVYRLREITFGYSFPKSMYKRLPIGSLSLSVTGRNLFFYAPGMPKYSHFDPEVNSLSTANTQGLEFAGAPAVKRFGLNLNVTF
jgi:TonB-linked SusC/RagA family outer membrane protein